MQMFLLQSRNKKSSLSFIKTRLVLIELMEIMCLSGCYELRHKLEFIVAESDPSF